MTIVTWISTSAETSKQIAMPIIAVIAIKITNATEMGMEIAMLTISIPESTSNITTAINSDRNRTTYHASKETWARAHCFIITINIKIESKSNDNSDSNSNSDANSYANS